LQRVWLFCLALVLSSVLVGPVGTASAANPLDYDIPGGHFYTQANGQAGAGNTGFAITNEAGLPFWNEFQRLGGVNALGYPISGRFMWDGFLVQATQKVVMQWRPEVNQVYFVNLYDRMHDLGKDPWLTAFRGIGPIADWTSDTGMPFDQVTLKHLALLDANPAIKARYYAAPGDAVTLNGLPMAPIVPDNITNPNYYVLRAQRITIQQWVVDAPASGVHAGDVVVTNAGDEAKIVEGTGIYPANAPLAPAPVGQPNGVIDGTGVTPTATATAGTSTGTTATTGFKYGFAAHQYNGQEGPVLDKVTGAGFGWVKQQVEWKSIQEGGPNDFNYGELDTIVNQAAARNVKVLLSVVQAPVWASVGPGRPYPKNPSDLGNFLKNMATRYKGKVQAYEIWNEVNLAVEVGPGNINPGNYVELLHAAHDAIKAVDPNIIIVSAGPTPTGVNDANIAIEDPIYIQQMYAYQNGVVKNYFDVLGAHAEPWANPPEAVVGSPEPSNVQQYNNHPSFFFRRIESYRNAMVAAGDGNKQIWETEFGYDSCPDPNPAPNGYSYCKLITEQQQADYLVRAFSYAKSNYPWLGAIFVWNLNFQNVVAPSDEKWGWSVLRGDYSPRPAYNALRSMPK